MEITEIIDRVDEKISPQLKEIHSRIAEVEYRLAIQEGVIRGKFIDARGSAICEINSILARKLDNLSIQISEEELSEILGAAMREMR